MDKRIGAAQFKASCLRIIDEVNQNGQTVTITKRGNPVARLTPIEPDMTRRSIIGALKGSVLRYDDPYAPASDPSDWNAGK